MSIFETLSNLNPFKKKDDLVFPPLEDKPNFETFNEQNFNQGLESTPNFSNHQEQLDPRMRMPLGENIRQERMNSMYHDNNEVYEHQNSSLQKDLELISAKLDYLKASLDAINQRLVNLEHMAKQETEKNYSFQQRRY
ncbi:MAG: hypothetical protein QXE31_00385 [Candidatus Woesearchaeota archaeon]